MGLEIDRDQFLNSDFDRFADRLATCLGVLEALLARPGFGRGTSSIGAELEVALVDEKARAYPGNTEVLRETLDERMTLELDRFNLECNLLHSDLAGRPFAHMRRELESARDELSRAAAEHGARVAMIGILPTLTQDDFGPSAMTDSVRYRALSRSLRGRRGGPFRLDIDGADPLRLDCDDVTFEGAATSFQVHLRVAPEAFRDVFDALQLATAPSLAIAANSPTFLGHRLWDETRVALFKQAVDERGAGSPERPARVSFGTGWLSQGPIELFRQAVRDYSVLLPVVYDEDPEAVLQAGGVPALREIRLHQGTVWSWNRPVYDPHDGGHVRIELRALPSGPTIEDMLANTAFAVGLALGIAPHMARVREEFAFDAAHANFYRAAQSGPNSLLHWPRCLGGGDEPTRAAGLAERLTEVAREGLLAHGIDAEDVDPLLDTIGRRAARGLTPAGWQRARLAAASPGQPTAEGLAEMLEDYLVHSASGEPVDGWGLD